ARIANPLALVAQQQPVYHHQNHPTQNRGKAIVTSSAPTYDPEPATVTEDEKGNVNPNVSMPLGNASRTANILEHKTPRCSAMSNTPLSSNSLATRRDNSINHRLWVLKAHDRKSQTSN
ncbi:hypothetical protein Tco_0416295, partial [Tanacetum coccineum]